MSNSADVSSAGTPNAERHGSCIVTTRTTFVARELEPYGSGAQLARSIDEALGRLVCDFELVGVALAPISLGSYAAAANGTTGVVVTAILKAPS